MPGISAAGFKIGDCLENMKDIVRSATTIDIHQPIKINFNKEIADSQGWILTPERGTSNTYDNTSLYYKDRWVRLIFNTKGILYAIYTFEGYQGKLFDRIKIGSLLSETSDFFSVEYDSGDDMHYPSEESGIKGIGLIAAEMPLEEDPTQRIYGFCIHNWRLGEE
ncbi:MAG TPA: hypothetical protein V6D15_16270 [Oculatellaceae cyanobacterium]